MSATFISKIPQRTKKVLYRIIHFGFFLTLFDYLFEITKSNFFAKIKHIKISNWLKRNFKYFVNKHYDNANAISVGEIPKKIWVCWWDGIDTMPPIIRACYNSIILNAGMYQVTLITKENYTQYINFPDHVLSNVGTGKMSLTHFSNLIRMSLLYNYGGLWLDITFLATAEIKLEGCSFFTIRTVDFDFKHIAKGKWQGNCIAGVPGHYFFKFIYEFLCEYWRKYSCLMTYHLYDYSINLAYESFPEVKKIFDSLPKFNKNDIIKYNLNNELDPGVFKHATNDTIFHKLTWKGNFNEKTSNDQLTFYGYILEKYKGNIV